MRAPVRAVMPMALILIQGCSLVPVLTSHTPTRTGDIVIIVSHPDNNSAAWLLRRELENSLYLPDLQGPARLEIALSDTLERLTLERDGQVTRTIHFARADYVLRAADGSELVRNSAHTQGGYDPTGYGFADVIAQADQRQEAAVRLARDIRIGLTNALRHRK